MSLVHRIRRLVEDPPPEFVFELSEAGIAWARCRGARQVAFEPLEQDVLSVSPLRDNILRPEALSERVRKIVHPNGQRRRRRAVLILPDYCARVAVLEFDSFPADANEQLSLIRFRMRKTVPFDLDSAVIRYQAQPAPKDAKRVDVVVVAAALEILARYESPFRAAGLQPGFVTTSTLAAAELEKAAGIEVLVKISGRALTITVLRNGVIKLIRSIELGEVTQDELMSVLYPTIAYIEDEMATKPSRLVLCGFGADTQQVASQWSAELGLEAAPLESRLGAPGQFNAGLLGYLESMEA